MGYLAGGASKFGCAGAAICYPTFYHIFTRTPQRSVILSPVNASMNASVASASMKIESIILDSGETAIRIGALEIRPGSRQALSGHGRVQLTGRELEVLMILVEQPDRVVPREVMYRQVWGGVMPNRDRAIDTYVRRVREKLATLTPDIAHIHTHFGIGYRFWPQPVTHS